MKRVAITYHESYDVTPYSEAVRACGMEPVLAAPHCPIASLAGLQGLVLSGGTDISTALYGEEPQPLTETPELDRDELEVRLLREAMATGMPVLAICRGMQLLNVLQPGGTLIQHIEGHATRTPDKSEPAHSVVVTPSSRLAEILGPGEHEVNSRHHQAVGVVGEGLLISARSADGVIEGLELPGSRFVVAVQWHPENQVHRFQAQKNLFLALSDAL